MGKVVMEGDDDDKVMTLEWVQLRLTDDFL